MMMKTGNIISLYSDLHITTSHISPQNMFLSIFMLYTTSVKSRGMLNNYSSNYVVLVCRESFGVSIHSHATHNDVSVNDGTEYTTVVP